MNRTVFLDTETTGLDPAVHEPWEIAVIVPRGTGDEELTWQVPVDLSVADPMALRKCRFYERRDGGGDPEAVAGQLAVILDGAHLVGACPWFDAAMLARFLRRNRQAPTWSHRLICVENMTAAVLGWDVPRGLAQCAQALGVEVDPDDAHTALGDARTARAVYDAIRARREAGSL